MPFDFFGSFAAGSAEPRWVKLSHAFAEALASRHPRLRFRIRQVAPPGAPVEVPPEIVSELLKPRVKIPEAEEFWVYLYECRTCKVGGVTHGERLNHKDHELVKTRPVKRGVKRPWGFTAKRESKRVINEVWFGLPELVAGRASGYAHAVTIPGTADLRGFAEVHVLPLRRGYDYAGYTVVLRKELGVDVFTLPSGIEPAADELVARYCRTDPEALDPEDPEAAELAEQQQRAESVRGVLAKRFANLVKSGTGGIDQK